ncbi:hypothetical protein F0562_010869 [Nyssa sinensis]|uniref:Uncharacterized protein n=1 Tax=Nyssa sinensis TaxID=561372 RepID=A0A5J5A527_9ASTE|nr:hypothetical protein F0562_010869 [Nyssa sinensis]
MLLLGAVSLAKLLHLMTTLGGGFGGAGVGAAAGDGGDDDGGDDEFGVTEFRSIRSYCCAGGDDAIGGGVDFYQWWPWPVEKLTEMTQSDRLVLVATGYTDMGSACLMEDNW